MAPLLRSARTAAPVAAVAALLLSGCSMGSDAFNENFPADDPGRGEAREVRRTPEVVSTELPSTEAPLLVPLPGPTGQEVPGDVPTSFPGPTPGETERAPTTEE